MIYDSIMLTKYFYSLLEHKVRTRALQPVRIKENYQRNMCLRKKAFDNVKREKEENDTK